MKKYVLCLITSFFITISLCASDHEARSQAATPENSYILFGEQLCHLIIQKAFDLHHLSTNPENNGVTLDSMMQQAQDSNVFNSFNHEHLLKIFITLERANPQSRLHQRPQKEADCQSTKWLVGASLGVAACSIGAYYYDPNLWVATGVIALNFFSPWCGKKISQIIQNWEDEYENDFIKSQLGLFPLLLEIYENGLIARTLNPQAQ